MPTSGPYSFRLHHFCPKFRPIVRRISPSYLRFTLTSVRFLFHLKSPRFSRSISTVWLPSHRPSPKRPFYAGFRHRIHPTSRRISPSYLRLALTSVGFLLTRVALVPRPGGFSPGSNYVRCSARTYPATSFRRGEGRVTHGLRNRASGMKAANDPKTIVRDAPKGVGFSSHRQSQGSGLSDLRSPPSTQHGASSDGATEAPQTARRGA